MKKILILIILLVLGVLVLFVKDPNEEQKDALMSIYDRVITANAEQAQNSCLNWQKTLVTASAGERTTALDNAFRQLVTDWKRVETTYIAGDLDIDATDYPRYIDIFHTGNENIARQMDKVLRSDNEPAVALYKNSYKTVNALDYLLYRKQTLTERDLALAGEITNNLCGRLSDVVQTYQKHRNEFAQSPEAALSMIANALAGQTLSLKDWRIGDAAGLTKKYEGMPDAMRAEFPYSKLGRDAALAILQTQAQIVTPQKYANLVQIADIYGAQKQLGEAQHLLEKSIALGSALNGAQWATPAVRDLYTNVGALQLAYYNNLNHALPVIAKILEADGD